MTRVRNTPAPSPRLPTAPPAAGQPASPKRSGALADQREVAVGAGPAPGSAVDAFDAVRAGPPASPGQFDAQAPAASTAARPSAAGSSAARLRDAEGFTPAPGTGCLPLHTILTFLSETEAGDRLVAKIRTELERRFPDPPLFGGDPPFGWKPQSWDPPFWDAIRQRLLEQRMMGLGYNVGVHSYERVVPGDADVRGRLPAAVVEVFARLSDANGGVSLEGVRQRFGKEAQALFEEIAAAVASGPARLPRNAKGKWACFADQNLVEPIARGLARDLGAQLRSRMPALETTLQTFGANKPLRNFRVLAIQHLFESTQPLLEALRSAGAHRIQVLGKPYSSQPDPLRAMVASGIEIQESGSESNEVTSLLGGGNASFIEPSSPLLGGFETISRDDFIKRWLEKQLAELQPGEKLLLLDDGGHLIEALHKYFPQYLDRCVAVEQTQNGLNRLASLQLGCPVISVAGSWLKKEYESPLIGESVAASIEGALRGAGVALPSEKTATILGYGAVGRATAQALLRRGYRVTVYDVDPKAMERAKADGCSPCADRDKALGSGKVVVGCVGRTDVAALSAADYDKLPDGAIVANAASGNHELSADNPEFAGRVQTAVRTPGGDLEGQFAGRRVRLGDGAVEDPTRTHLVHQAPSGKSALVLFGGYVVNMAQDIPPEFIQLTRASLLLGCLQAAGESTPGMRELRDDGQHTILDVTRASLSAAGLALEKPDFAVLQLAGERLAPPRADAPSEVLHGGVELSPPAEPRAAPMPPDLRGQALINELGRRAQAAGWRDLRAYGVYVLDNPDQIRDLLQTLLPRHNHSRTDLDLAASQFESLAADGWAVPGTEQLWFDAVAQAYASMPAMPPGEVGKNYSISPLEDGHVLRRALTALRHREEIESFVASHLEAFGDEGARNIEFAVRQGLQMWRRSGANFDWVLPSAAIPWLDAITTAVSKMPARSSAELMKAVKAEAIAHDEVWDRYALRSLRHPKEIETFVRAYVAERGNEARRNVGEAIEQASSGAVGWLRLGTISLWRAALEAAQ